MRRRDIAVALTLAAFVVSDWTFVYGQTGNVSGDVSFENQSSAVASYLNSHAALPDPGDSLRLYLDGSTSSPHKTSYSSSGGSDPVAGYVATPAIDQGDTFNLELSFLEIGGGGPFYSARYRFASRFLNSPARQSCGPVTAASTTCGIGECAALANVNVSLVGTTEVLNALDSSVPVACNVTVTVGEGSGR